ncbi:hypothetical protein VTK73DRAFT_2424 [Phialemonium thermophilum]|uniref:Uncharacterized protein n=1 Tax=Phialemonium thermophilum TaxID=223376 RepID=A0ABR3VS54_9PEZI
MFVKPYRPQHFFLVSFVGMSGTVIGMLIWSLAASHGAGNLVSSTQEILAGETEFQFFQAVCALTTSYSGMSIRPSDCSQDGKTPPAVHWVPVSPNPLFVAITAIFGVLVTSAMRDVYGTII